MEIFRGLAVSDGIVLGNIVFVPTTLRPPVECRTVAKAEQAAGWKRFQAARAKVRRSLEKLLGTADTVDGDVGLSKSVDDIFQTHLLMLSDEVFVSDLRITYIKSGHNIEYVLDQYVGKFAETLRSSDVALLSERAADILDVFGAVSDTMARIARFDYDSIKPGTILAAATMEPTALLTAVKKGAAAVVLGDGGTASHGAIILRSYRVPGVFQVKQLAERLAPLVNGAKRGVPGVLDATDGRLFVLPDEATRQQLTEKALSEAKLKQGLAMYLDKPCVTKDGTELIMLANIGSAEEALSAAEAGAAGVGLFRSEFLFMETGAALSEEMQFRCYKQVLETMGGKPVTIRTLDAGGDKVVAAVNLALGDKKAEAVESEKNPLLGQRGIRLSLAAIELFTTQLRALLRAGLYGDLRILLPMVTRVEEVTGTLRLIDSIKRHMDAQGVAFKKDIKLGVMIETPAAALISEALSSYCDFFSIGTNDLTQYTMAIDRENPGVSRFYNEFHPAVLQLISMTVKNTGHRGIPVAVCGEMAGTAQGARILAGLGVRMLSVAPHRIAPLKALFAGLSDADLGRTGSLATPAARIDDASGGERRGP